MKFIAALMLSLFATSAIPQDNAQASLNFKIVIPTILKIDLNDHPIIVDPVETVEQRVHVFNNLKQGFCLRIDASEFPAWKLEVKGDVEVESNRVCSTKLGTTEVVLQHNFGNLTEISWPVTVEVTSR